MKRKLPCPALLFAALLAIAGASHAVEPAPTLLLRYQFTFAFDGIESVSEALIYRDGLVVISGAYTTRFDLALISRGVATPAGLKALKTLLAEKRVAAQVAENCVILVHNFPADANFHAVLTWFGRNGRQKRLEFGKGTLSGGFEECSDDVNSIFLGVESFLSDVPYSDRVQTLP